MKYNVFGRKEGQEGSTTTFENQNGEGNDNSPRSAASVDMMGVIEPNTCNININNDLQSISSDEVEELEQNDLNQPVNTHEQLAYDIEESMDLKLLESPRSDLQKTKKKYQDSIDLKLLDFSRSDLPKTKNKRRVKKFLTKKEQIKRRSLIEGKATTFHPDCYSFISTNTPQSPYWWFGIMVFVFQVLFLFLIIMGTTSKNWKSGKVDDNPTDGVFADFINTEASPVVHVTRFVALLTSIIFIDSSVMDIIVAVHSFPTYTMVTKRDNFWNLAFSCILRFTQGFITQLVMLILIFNTNDPIDIILNFTALNFVSQLDDMAFDLAKSGKYGRKFENECMRVEQTPLPVCMYRNHKDGRFLVTIIFLGVVVFAIFFIFVYKMYHPTQWETQRLRIQFKKDDGFQVYNGCYYKDMDRKKNLRRNFYNSSDVNQKTAQFGFCGEDRRWRLFEGNSTETDVCNKTAEIIHSTHTDYFDISTMFKEDWFTKTGVPVELYFFEDEPEGENLDCDAFMKDGICNSAFNTEVLQWDGGDCCANTCDHPACRSGGLFNAFGSVNTSGDGFPNCTDTRMVPLTIQLNSFTKNRDLYKEKSNQYSLSEMNRTYIKRFIPDFWEVEPEDALLSIICDGDEVLRYYVNPTMENQSEVIKVNDGAECTIRIENTTSSNPSFDDDPVWFVNYTIFDGVPQSIEDNPTRIRQDFTFDNGVVSFEKIPECYFDILSEHIDYKTIYGKKNPSSEAINLIVDENSRSTSCSPYLMERYALYAMNFAAPTLSYLIFRQRTELWIEQDRPCTWQHILCSGQVDASSIFDLLDLDLSGLQLSGYIATEIGLLYNLALYDVSNNFMSGSIPSEIGLLTELSLLRLNDNRLTGSIPTEIGLLTLMEELFLESNKFNSTIPTEIGLLTDLVDLTIGDNDLTGTIPSEIGLLTSLTLLRLGSNRLTGPIPSEIALLTNLHILNVADNDLTGSIPSEIGLLKLLSRLDVDETSLTGFIPTEMERLEALNVIYMDGIPIPKESVPTSLAGKIAETCTPCAGLDFDLVISTMISDGVNDKCSTILTELKNRRYEGRVSIDACNFLHGQCIVCKTSSESNALSSQLTELP